MTLLLWHIMNALMNRHSRIPSYNCCWGPSVQVKKAVHGPSQQCPQLYARARPSRWYLEQLRRSPCTHVMQVSVFSSVPSRGSGNYDGMSNLRSHRMPLGRWSIQISMVLSSSSLPCVTSQTEGSQYHLFRLAEKALWSTAPNTCAALQLSNKRSVFLLITCFACHDSRSHN